MRDLYCINITDLNDWNTLTSKIISYILGKNLEFTPIGQWLGFYYFGTKDIVFVVRCSSDLNPSGIMQYHLSLPLTDECCIVWVNAQDALICGGIQVGSIMASCTMLKLCIPLEGQ